MCHALLLPGGFGEAGCAPLFLTLPPGRRSWDPNLRLFTHDCRHYCSALLTRLTNQEVKVEDLQDLVASSRSDDKLLSR